MIHVQRLFDSTIIVWQTIKWTFGLHKIFMCRSFDYCWHGFFFCVVSLYSLLFGEWEGERIACKIPLRSFSPLMFVAQIAHQCYTTMENDSDMKPNTHLFNRRYHITCTERTINIITYFFLACKEECMWYHCIIRIRERNKCVSQFGDTIAIEKVITIKIFSIQYLSDRGHRPFIPLIN